MSNRETDHSDVQCRTKQQSEESNELAEFNKTLSSYDLLPLFESQYNAFVRIRQYSMTTNEKLRSRWHDRLLGKQEVVGVRTMPLISDYHFCNCRTILNGSLSPANLPTLRRHLVPGPGVDKFGQLPIPADMTARKPEPKHSPASAAKSETKRTKEGTEPHELGVSV